MRSPTSMPLNVLTENLHDIKNERTGPKVNENLLKTNDNIKRERERERDRERQIKVLRDNFDSIK